MFDFLDRNNSHLFISVETARIRHIHHQIAEYWSQRKYSKILPKKIKLCAKVYKFEQYLIS